ncbi:MAG TPA: hypothetical protein VN716_19040 [Vicinamibacterales bacterium]|nr:hypothetical protein [Vicinamibacterales bacterium]
MLTRPGTPLDVKWNAAPLREAVTEAGLDPADIAVRLRELSGRRVSPQTVRTWLIGQHEPPATMFGFMAAIVRKSPNALLGIPSALPSARGSVKRASR